MKPLEFWYSIGSTYSYLTIMRIGKLAEQAGVTLDWRPFSVREIMVEMDNVPFAKKPIKAAYMWRDIERRAAGFNVPVKVPAPYPLTDFDRANRIAILARQEGWCDRYTLESYKRWFQQGIPAGSDACLAEVLPLLGQDVARILDAQATDDIGRAYSEATQEARDRGIFGAPSFVAGDSELFWGDDRLEEALAWHTRA